MISDKDLLFYGGTAALQKHGRLLRTIRIPRLNGEEWKETLVRAAPNGSLFGGDGTLRYAEANAPRISFLASNQDAGVAKPVWLLETTRQNKALQTEDLNTTWIKNGLASVGVNADPAPDGSTNADRIIENASNVLHGVSQGSFTITANANYLIHGFLKAGSRSWFRFKISDGGSMAVNQWFNLTTGAKGSSSVQGTGTFVEAFMVPVPGFAGYYWCCLVGNVGNGVTTVDGQVIMATADGGGAYAGDGASYLTAWGLQVEEGRFPTSYLPNTTIAQTRARDIATVPWTGPTMAMQIYVRFIDLGTLYGTGDGGTGMRVLTLGSDVGNCNLLIYSATGSSLYRVRHYNGIGSVDCDLPVTHVYRDRVEFLADLFPDGSVRNIRSINGGAQTVGSQSVANAFQQKSWSSNILAIGNNGTGVGAGGLGLEALIATRGNGYVMDEFRALLP